MADISRVFSPVVVFTSDEARPRSTDRIRSASGKRIVSGNTRRTSRVSSAVSTIENNTNSHSRYVTPDRKDDDVLEINLQQELNTRKRKTQFCS
jgi:hypothetical protein